MTVRTVGEALYQLVQGDYDGDGSPERVNVWPVVKVTDRYVFVYGPYYWDRERTYRLDRAVLEEKGCQFHRGRRVRLHVRPGVDWPLMVIDVNDGRRALSGRSA